MSLWPFNRETSPVTEQVLRANVDELSEDNMNLQQRIAELEGAIEKMTIWRDIGELNQMSLRTAQLIEDEFAKHHDGGRTQRLAKVQLIVRETVREALTGTRNWNTWQPGNFLGHPTAPVNPTDGKTEGEKP